ncbi:MAG: DUF502 domain-containing protein [Bacillota bacterium]
MFKHLRNYFFTGILVLLPLVITLKLLFWGFEKTDAILGNLIYRYLHRYLGIQVRISGLGLFALLLLITLTGMFARNYLGKKLIGAGEKLLGRIPILKTIYNSTKQITEGLALTQSDKGAFRKMVLIEYPRPGVYSPGFLTGEAFNEAEEKTGGKLLSIFVPTTPNPTTGYLVFVPEDQVTFLKMSVEDGFKLLLSVGVIVPDKKMNNLKR